MVKSLFYPTSAWCGGRPGILLLACAALLTGVLALAPPAHASLQFTVHKNQMSVMGKIEGNDGWNFKRALANNPAVDTIVLVHQPGGRATEMEIIAGVIQEKKLNTIALGHCMSACAHIFLAGEKRQFAAGFPLKNTHLGYHSSYHSAGSLKNYAAGKLTNWERWYVNRTEGKLPAEIVLRWVNLQHASGFAIFRHPSEPQFGAVSFMCDSVPLKDCEKLDKSALDFGILTSSDLAPVLLEPFWNPSKYTITEHDVEALLELEFMTRTKRRVVNRSIAWAAKDKNKGQHVAVALDEIGRRIAWAGNSSVELAIIRAKNTCQLTIDRPCHVIAIDGKLVRTPQQIENRDYIFKP